MKCGSCGADIEQDNKFCPNCGAEQHVVSMQKPASEPNSEPKEDPDGTRKMFNPNPKIFVIGILTGVLVIMLAAAAGYMIYSRVRRGEQSGQYAQTASAVTAEPEAASVSGTESPLSAADGGDDSKSNIGVVAKPSGPPQFTLESYSSEHPDSSDGVSSDNYYAAHVADGDPQTAWIPVCEDDGLSPVGHWVEFKASSPQYVSGLTFVNGFAKDSRKYFNNYRVKGVKIIIDGTEEIYTELADLGCGNEEYIPFGKTYSATTLRVVIQSVYDTDPMYKEAAISEITPELY